MGDVLDRLEEFSWPALLTLAFLFAWAGGAMGLDLVAPGEAALVLIAGALDDRAELSVLAVVVVATGAIAGDSTSFALGRAGARLFDRWAWLRRRVEQPRHRARSFLQRRGAGAVVVARWFGPLQAVVPFVAGSTRAMRYRRFLAWDALAAFSWAAAVVGVGVAFGDDAADVLESFEWWTWLVVAGAVAAYALWRRSRGRRTT